MFACKMCGEEFPVTSEYFNRNTSYASGYSHVCRKCEREYKEKFYKRRAESSRLATVAKMEAQKSQETRGVRVVIFPDTWKPNREGMQMMRESHTGVHSSLDIRS